MRVKFGCMVGVGEQIEVELDLDGNTLSSASNGDTAKLDRFLKPAFYIMDKRRFDLNQRLMATHTMVHKLKLPPSVLFQIDQTIKLVYGMISPEQAGAGADAPPPAVVEADKAAIEEALAKLSPEELAAMGTPKPAVLSIVKPEPKGSDSSPGELA